MKTTYEQIRDTYRMAWMRKSVWQGLEDEFNRRQLLGEDCTLLVQYMLTVVNRRKDGK